MESWPGIPADGLLTMPIALAVPLDRPAARAGQPDAGEWHGVDRGGKHLADNLVLHPL